MGKQNKVLIEGLDLDSLQELIQIGVKNGIEEALESSRFGTEFKDEILTRKQAAELLGKSPDKVSLMYENKEIPGFKTGKEYSFLKSQLIKMFKYKR